MITKELKHATSSSTSYQALKGNCPVCQGARKDCRENVTNKIVHCRHDVTSISGFKCVGIDRIGFNMWVSADEPTYNTAELEKIRQARLQAWAAKQELQARQRSYLLSIPERDRELKELLSQLTLTKIHKQNLSDRGLNETEIQAGQFRSVCAWQPITKISSQLAGVDQTGQKLLISQSGIICPIWNPQKQLIGWQTRFDHPDRQGKYRWPTSRNAKHPTGATVHLPNGELPLTCCRPLENPNFAFSKANSTGQAIGLAEGFLKPFIAAQKLQQVIIGAAGGNFAASSETLKNYLDYLSGELNTKVVQLYPDAGAIANFNVLQQYQKVINLLRTWGYEVQVGWWDQFDKGTDPDIDELDANQLHSIAYISPEAFWQLCAPEIQTKLNHDPSQEIGLLHKFKIWLQRLRKHYKQAKGFGQATAKINKVVPEIINYTPGCIPRPDQCSTPPQIIFKAGQRLQVLIEAIAAGWQHLLDASTTGTSKSYDAGEAIPGVLGTRQIFYLSPQHRNPTVSTIEGNYRDLPVRHNGLKQDFSRTTPLGKPYTVWPKLNEPADTQGNCFRNNLFAALRRKNIAEVESIDNPICHSCHLLNACRGSTGEGFGFKYERHKALISDRIRAHPDSTPDLNYDWQNVGIFWDEALQTLQPTHTVTAKLADIDAVIAEIATKLPEPYLQLRNALNALRQRINGEIAQPYYGWSDRDLREVLGTMPQQLPEIIATVQGTLKPNLDWLQPPDGIAVNKISDLTPAEKSLLYRASEILRQQDYRETQELVETRILLNWLLPFLMVWSQQTPGALRLESGKLTITTRNQRHSAIAKAAKWNCYQDATATVEQLGLYLDIDPNQVLTIAQATPNHQNLEIIQVSGLGKVGKNRSEFCSKRVAAIKQELQQQHNGNLGVIDWKNATTTGDGAWFVNSRGSNEFQNMGAIAAFGVPYSNIGELEARYITLTKQAIDPDHSSEFQAFIQQITDAEIIQAVGRLRSHLRPEQQLKFYFCADYELPEIPQAGKFTIIKAAELTLAAADKGERSFYLLADACQQLWSTGQKITQQAIAEISGLSQGYISKLIALLGGWQEWKKLFLSLLDPLNSKWNNFETLTEHTDQAENLLESSQPNLSKIPELEEPHLPRPARRSVGQLFANFINFGSLANSELAWLQTQSSKLALSKLKTLKGQLIFLPKSRLTSLPVRDPLQQYIFQVVSLNID